LIVEYLPKGSPELSAVEQYWRDKEKMIYLLVSKYYLRFTNLKTGITNYYRTKRFNLNILKYLLENLRTYVSRCRCNSISCDSILGRWKRRIFNITTPPLFSWEQNPRKNISCGNHYRAACVLYCRSKHHSWCNVDRNPFEDFRYLLIHKYYNIKISM
jgi:hypothetical protein